MAKLGCLESLSLIQASRHRVNNGINVLRGEMLIAGPSLYIAPPSQPFAEHLSDVLRRSTLRPGLFRSTQIHFSLDRDAQSNMTRQIEDDLFYIVNWPLLLDAKSTRQGSIQ